MFYTQRLRIEPFSLEHAERYTVFLHNNREHLKYNLPDIPENFFTVYYQVNAIYDYEKRLAEGREYRFIIFEKDSKDIAGNVGFSNVVRGAFHSCNLGYNLDKDMTGKGYMQEALLFLIEYMFTYYKLHRIEAGAITTNTRSINILRKLEFEEIGLAKEYLKLGGEWRDHILFQKINKLYS